jgi:Tol biopolymer transport system component
VHATFAQFTSDPGIEWFPSVSPDGKWIVYAADSSGNRDIYLQSITGQKPLNLTMDSAADDDQPSFSPDGEQIAFRSERDGGGIFVMGRTGEAARRITREGYRPTWSSDGTRLAFSTEPVDISPQNGRGPTELRIVDVRTGAVRSIPDAGLVVHASWSPHDLRLALSVRSSGARQMDLATIPVAGGPATPLVSGNAVEWNAVWSADGRFIYYTSDAGGTMNLWRVRVDESSGRALSAPEPVPTPSPLAAHPAVSSDGRRLAFSSVLVTTNVARMSFDPVAATFDGRPWT